MKQTADSTLGTATTTTGFPPPLSRVRSQAAIRPPTTRIRRSSSQGQSNGPRGGPELQPRHVAAAHEGGLHGTAGQEQPRRDPHPDQAQALLKIGESPANEKLDQSELAAWTMVSSILLNLDETVTNN